MTRCTVTRDARDAWAARAEELSDWALVRFFARRDRYGGYYVDCDTGETRKTSRPKDKPLANVVSSRLVQQHFRATGPADVVGAYCLAPEPKCVGRVASADIDAHDADADPERNRRYAAHLYYNLAAIGFRPLLATWGAGSFHLHVLFDRDLSGTELHAFGRWVVSDANSFAFTAPVESFPKQANVEAGKFGNWLRLVGRHHTRDVWAKVFDGTSWLEGAAAVAHVLALTGDSPDLIPAEAKPARRQSPQPSTNGHAYGKPAAGRTSPDVFEDYNCRATLDLVVGQLELRGHTPVRREADRVELRRAGKAVGGGESFNVKIINDIPITYNFSPNAGLPDHKGLNPAQLRCYLQFGSIDKAAMAKLADALKAELGWPVPARPAPAGTEKPEPVTRPSLHVPDDPPTSPSAPAPARRSFSRTSARSTNRCSRTEPRSTARTPPRSP